MEDHNTRDSGSVVRHARFGALPERIAYEDMVEMKQAASTGSARDTGNPEGTRELLSCLAWDLVL